MVYKVFIKFLPHDKRCRTRSLFSVSKQNLLFRHIWKSYWNSDHGSLSSSLMNKSAMLDQSNPTFETCKTVKYETEQRKSWLLFSTSNSIIRNMLELCLCGTLILHCGEFSVLDKNQRRSRIFWNASWLLDCGRMSRSMHQDGYMRSYWLGAKQHWANLLDSNNEIHEKYYDERSYCSLRTTPRLPGLILSLILTVAIVNSMLSRYSSLVVINKMLSSFKQAVHYCMTCGSCWLHRL